MIFNKESISYIPAVANFGYVLEEYGAVNSDGQGTMRSSL